MNIKSSICGIQHTCTNFLIFLIITKIKCWPVFKQDPIFLQLALGRGVKIIYYYSCFCCVSIVKEIFFKCLQWYIILHFDMSDNNLLFLHLKNTIMYLNCTRILIKKSCKNPVDLVLNLV